MSDDYNLSLRCVDCGQEIGEVFECVNCRVFMCKQCADIDDLCGECLGEESERAYDDTPQPNNNLQGNPYR